MTGHKSALAPLKIWKPKKKEVRNYIITEKITVYAQDAETIWIEMEGITVQNV